MECFNVVCTQPLILYALQEVDKISKALKDDEFRKLFFDYAKEISDPENKQVRGNNVLLCVYRIRYG